MFVKTTYCYGFLEPHIETRHYIFAVDVLEIIQVTSKQEFRELIEYLEKQQ